MNRTPLLLGAGALLTVAVALWIITASHARPVIHPDLPVAAPPPLGVAAPPPGPLPVAAPSVAVVSKPPPPVAAREEPRHVVVPLSDLHVDEALLRNVPGASTLPPASVARAKANFAMAVIDAQAMLAANSTADEITVAVERLRDEARQDMSQTGSSDAQKIVDDAFVELEQQARARARRR